MEHCFSKNMGRIFVTGLTSNDHQCLKVFPSMIKEEIVANNVVIDDNKIPLISKECLRQQLQEKEVV